MKRKATRVAGVVLLALFCSAVLLWAAYDFRRGREKASDRKQFEAKYVEITRKLNVGSRVEDVLAYAQTNHLAVIGSGSTEIGLRLQTIRSAEWYCSYWGGYASFTISGDRVISVRPIEFGDVCL